SSRRWIAWPRASTTTSARAGIRARSGATGSRAPLRIQLGRERQAHQALAAEDDLALLPVVGAGPALVFGVVGREEIEERRGLAGADAVEVAVFGRQSVARIVRADLARSPRAGEERAVVPGGIGGIGP